jgi:hypothetical protein
MAFSIILKMKKLGIRMYELQPVEENILYENKLDHPIYSLTGRIKASLSKYKSKVDFNHR